MDREFYKRFYAVQFTKLKENQSELTKEQQKDQALEKTQNKYYADLERMVLNKDFILAFSIVDEFKRFLEEVCG